MMPMTPGMVSLDADEGRNRVVTGVDSAADTTTVRRLARSLRFPDEALVIEVTGPFVPFSSEVPIPMTSKETSATRRSGSRMEPPLCCVHGAWQTRRIRYKLAQITYASKPQPPTAPSASATTVQSTGFCRPARSLTMALGPLLEKWTFVRSLKTTTISL